MVGRHYILAHKSRYDLKQARKWGRATRKGSEQEQKRVNLVT